MKFRIVKLTYNVNSKEKEVEFVIEKKCWWGQWKEVLHNEVKTKRVSHKTYEDAENYMMKEYMGWGVCKNVGSEYKYTSYTMFINIGDKHE